MKIIKIGLNGAFGRMGKAVEALINNEPDAYELVSKVGSICTQQQMNEANNQNQIQLQRELIEDTQLDAKDDIVLKGKVQMEVDNNNARNKMFQDSQQQQSDLLANIKTGM